MRTDLCKHTVESSEPNKSPYPWELQATVRIFKHWGCDYSLKCADKLLPLGQERWIEWLLWVRCLQLSYSYLSLLIWFPSSAGNSSHPFLAGFIRISLSLESHNNLVILCYIYSIYSTFNYSTCVQHSSFVEPTIWLQPLRSIRSPRRCPSTGLCFAGKAGVAVGDPQVMQIADHSRDTSCICVFSIYFPCIFHMFIV